MPNSTLAAGHGLRTSLLLEPTYGYQSYDGTPRRPTLREALRESADAVNLFRNRYRAAPFAFLLFHLTTAVIFVLSFTTMTWKTLIWALFVHQVLSLGYQTLWYHRYCSHGAFRFSSLWFARLLLWTNPIVLKEETYSIAHRLHHQRADAVGDPYGPHLGWVGSYLSWESLYKANPDITEREYDALKRSFQHLGFPMNDYRTYQRTGSVERLSHYAARTLVAQILFAGVSYAVGGVPCVLSGYAAVFVLTFLLREFAWRGHGGSTPRANIPGWEFDERSRSTNNRFYGYLAAEWHDNHHRLPTSANCAFLPGQIDVVYFVIRLLHRAGIVKSYYDGVPALLEKLRAAGTESTAARAPAAREAAHRIDAPATSSSAAGEVFLEYW